MHAKHRFPRPSPPLNRGQGLLGHAPPGFCGPPGMPPQGMPPTGVPPPPMPGGTGNAPQSGYPRGPPPGVPSVMSPPNNPQSQGTGLTSPIPGAVPSRGLLGNQPNISQPPPQSQIPGLPQQHSQQQMQQQSKSSLPGLPGDLAFSDLERDATLAIAVQLLKEKGFGGGTASTNLTNPTAQGLNNPLGASSTLIPDLRVPPPPFNNGTTQLGNMQNNQATQQQQQLQTSFTGMTSAMNTMPSINSMLHQQQQHQYNGTTGGMGISGVSSVGNMGSTSITTSPVLTLPGTIQTSSPYITSTNQGILNTPDIQSPPPQVPPTGVTHTTTKPPLLGQYPGVNPTSIPPPNHPNQAVIQPNPATNVYPQDPQQLATEHHHHNLSNNGNSYLRQGVSRVSFMNNIYFLHHFAINVQSRSLSLFLSVSCMFHCL